MRRTLALALLVVAAWLVPAGAATAGDAAATRSALAAQMRWAGAGSGAHVVDLDTGTTIYSLRPDGARVPASVQKLYTTATALLRLGTDATLATEVLSPAGVDLGGRLDGHLYLRGHGDPTLTRRDLDALALELVAATGLSEVTGRVIGDESAFDGRRGPPSSGYRTSAWVGPLGALVVDRGRTGRARPYWQADPADWAADAFARSLRRAGVAVSRAGRRGVTPAAAVPLGAHASAPMATLARLSNVPSDNFVAEMLLKAIGADADGVGTTAGGAAVVEIAMAGLGLHPRAADGSGLSRSNRTTPRQVVRLLARMASARHFTTSLALAGRTGTLARRMRRGAARGRCRGKTGTLYSVSNVAGYCRTAAGSTVAFAILMNGVNPWSARALQDRMASAIARYRP
ncbi:MAG TPA: D-alanyl-D-alanine carboxypeptidase/D-alanyl-D-alanine-endopeptidase [Solirubrobacteraceae bacterium]|nr:D-alanyl-D-alanine carboxypeptidase/D-alanyl-D-alanine-endopeptidase [Solirubrobacteraceae bacterium]